MKFIFFGTPESAAIVLEKLIKAGYIPSAVVCNPDEPIGRKQILTSPPVKRLITKHLSTSRQERPIEIFQSATKSELSAISYKLKAIKPDLIIVAAYGKIIPKDILDIPRYGTINIHGSLLPAYRGASPIQYAILNGDKETGVTIMGVDEEMDHGPILANSKLPVADSDTYEILSQKMAKLGAELLIKIIPDYISGKIKAIEQDHAKATYTKIIKKEDGKIDWSMGANKIERMTRAYHPWPGARTTWNNKIIKIIKADISNAQNSHHVGEVFLNENNKLAVRGGKDALIIEKLQLESGKILTAKEFLNGHKEFIRSVLK